MWSSVANDAADEAGRDIVVTGIALHAYAARHLFAARGADKTTGASMPFGSRFITSGRSRPPAAAYGATST